MVKFEKIMGKFVIFMILAAYVIVVGVVGWSLIESHGVKEVTVEAEVADILGVKERIREGASWDVIYKYSYNGKIYEEEVSGIKSCKQGDKANIVIPFYKKRKNCFSFCNKRYCCYYSNTNYY